MESGAAVGRAQLERAKPSDGREERLFRQHPGRRQPGIQDVAKPFPERVVFVAAQRARHEQPVLIPESLFDETPNRHRLLRRFAVRLDDAPRQRIRPGGELLDARDHAVQALVIVQEPPVRRRVECGGEGEGRGCIEIGRPVVELERIRLAIALVGRRVDRRRNESGNGRILVIPIDEIRSDDGMSLEPLQGAIIRLHAPGEVVDVLERPYRETLRRRQEAVSQVHRAVRGTQEATRQHAGLIIVVLRQAEFAVRVEHRRPEIEVVAREVADIRQHADLTVRADGINAVFIAEMTGDIERRLL